MADISGTVSEVYVSNGDAVSAGTELCRISASNDLTIDFQFSYAKDGDFYVGQPAKIYLNGYAGYIDGTVAQVGGSSMANATGMKMTTVRVKAVNPGLAPGDCTASAVVGSSENSITILSRMLNLLFFILVSSFSKEILVLFRVLCFPARGDAVSRGMDILPLSCGRKKARPARRNFGQTAPVNRLW